jgi:O-antigen/teichoic acid export membrane protein
MYLLALSLPAVASTAALRGVLEACQRFDLVNALRAPLSVFTYASPLLVLPFSSSLVPVIAILLVGRFGAWAAHLWLCLRTLPTLRRPRFRWDTVNELIRFGSWATVSNVISPLMVYLDRFLIGGILSVTAVAYYVTPFEVITKLLLVPMALLGVLFPAFASSFGSDIGRTVQLFWRGVRGLVLIMFPALLIVITLAPEGLQLWLGAEFAENSTVVLRWLAIGVFINSLGQAAFAVLQGIGRPDLTGKLHVVELPFYLVGLWLLVDAYGIAGAAAAWVFRIVIDTIALFVLADRFLLARGATLRAAAPLVGSTVAILCLATLLEGVLLKLIFLAVALAIFMLVGWKRILDSGERAVVRTTCHDRQIFETESPQRAQR